LLKGRQIEAVATDKIGTTSVKLQLLLNDNVKLIAPNKKPPLRRFIFIK